jgi:uncharacterized protein
MGERTSYAPGTFSWVDLATTDVDAARGFYGALFGWESEDLPAGEDATYTMLRKDGHDVAAMYAMRSDQRAAGVPPHWLSYVTVADVDDVAARAAELGGTVLAEPFDVLDAGRMAPIADPHGAQLALWQPGRNIGAKLVNEPGSLCWNDLFTPAPEEAGGFYGALFGWTIERIEGAEPAYYTIRNAAASNGGVMQAPPDQPGAPFWNAYFAIEDTDGAVATTEAAGGRVLMGPLDVPAGRIAVVMDPQGAAFSLFQGELDP